MKAVGAITGNWQLSLALLELLGLFVDFVRCVVEVICRNSETYRRSLCYISIPQIIQVVTRVRDQVIPWRGVMKKWLWFWLLPANWNVEIFCKGRVAPVHAVKECGGNGDTLVAPLILNCGTMLRSARFTSRPLYPRRKNLRIHWRGDWIGSRGGLDASKKRDISCGWGEFDLNSSDVYSLV
jgi:hypothetical protein